MEPRVARRRKSGVKQKISGSFSRETRSPQVIYSGSPVVQYDGNVLNFKSKQEPLQRVSDSSKSSTPSPIVSTELKLWSDRDRSPSSRNSSRNSDPVSQEDRELFQIMQRPASQEILFTVPQYDSWRMIDTLPKRKGILIGGSDANQFEIEEMRRSNASNRYIQSSPYFGKRREITQWDIASDSGISEHMDSWDLAAASRYSLADYSDNFLYHGDPVELILSKPGSSQYDQYSFEDYTSTPWHVKRLNETNTPMSLLYPERIDSPVGYKRYLYMSTPTLPERKRNLTEEIDLIRCNDVVQIRKRNETQGLENGKIINSFEENSSMEPYRYEPYYYEKRDISYSDYMRPRSPLPVYYAPPTPQPVYYAPPTPQPVYYAPPSPTWQKQSTAEEPYHEDSWVVYHTIPYYVPTPEEKYEIPNMPSFESTYTSSQKQVVSMPQLPVITKKEIAYSDLSERRSAVHFQEEAQPPDDYFYYQYQTPKKKRIIDSVKIQSNTMNVSGPTRPNQMYKGFPESLQILLRRYTMLQKKNNQRRTKDFTTMFPISGSLKETIKIDEDEKEVGDMSMVFDVHQVEPEVYSETYNTVNEKVNLNVNQKKATVEVKIEYELYTPLDLENGRWLRKRVIVTRLITLDLEASQETREIFNNLMQRSLPDLDWSLSGTVRVTGSDAFKVYNSLMAIVEEEEETMDPQSNDTVGLDTIPQYIEAGYDQYFDSALQF